MSRHSDLMIEGSTAVARGGSPDVGNWHSRDPSVAPAEDLLTEAMLKHLCVLPNRRPRCAWSIYRVASAVFEVMHRSEGKFRDGKVARETQYFGDPFEPGPSRAQWVERMR
jgi:hypothetical protein